MRRTDASGVSRLRNTRRAAVWSTLLGAALLLASCGRTSSSGSGETHFLKYCEGSCAPGFNCLCGVCTKSCSDTTSCGNDAPSAECRAANDECRTPHCDVSCEQDADCAALGAEHHCQAGSCREGVPPEPITCPPGCVAVVGYPEATSGGCVDTARGTTVGCACDGAGDQSVCRYRIGDGTLWLLPNGPLSNQEEWTTCSVEEKARVSFSCDFESCALPPPSTCDRADTCELIGCGGTQFAADGCGRPACKKDEDCASDERCVALPAKLTSFCSYSSAGTCECAGGTSALPGAFCNPISDVGPPPLGPICDGSNDVRFAWHAAGGFISLETRFLEPLGQFFVVNGQCQYYAMRNGKIGTGMLSAEQAEQLTQISHWPDYASWGSFTDRFSCPDAGVVSLLAPNIRLSCTCGCDDDAPTGLSQAFSEVTPFTSMVQDNAVSLMEAVSVIAIPWDEGMGDATVAAQAWPLTRELTSVAVPALESTTSGTYISDPDEVAALQALRAAWQGAGALIKVRDEAGDLHGVLVRDELPEDTREAVQALLAQAGP